MNKIVKNVVFIVFLLIGFQVLAQEPLWLSNTPPKSMEKEVKFSGMHRYATLKGKKRTKKTQYKTKNDKKENNTNSNKKNRGYKRPVTKYVHWLRKGNSVKGAAYVCLPDSTDYQLILMSPQGKKKPISLVKKKLCYTQFELNEEGYYNAYLIVKTGRGDTLDISIAKAELLSHSCRNGHHKKLEARPVQYYPEVTDFEMIRKRTPHEDYHFFVSSGDTETFKTLLDGKPLAGVKITINTEKGWSKIITTNENGEIDIQFIQDYFSKWEEIDKRKIYYYMLKANYTLSKNVQYKDKDYKYIHYTLTMSDGYRPSRTMYTSMVWGLIVFVITMLVSIVGFFIYKERRKNPYKEIKFSESNN